MLDADLGRFYGILEYRIFELVERIDPEERNIRVRIERNVVARVCISHVSIPGKCLPDAPTTADRNDLWILGGKEVPYFVLY